MKNKLLEIPSTVRAAIDTEKSLNENKVLVFSSISKAVLDHYDKWSDDREKFVQSLWLKPIEVTLYRFEDTALKMLTIRIQPSPDTSARGFHLVASTQTKYPLVPGVPGIDCYLGGSYQCLSRHLETNPIKIISNFADLVEELIQIEVDNSEHVSPPIRIVRVSSSGAAWIRARNECP